MEAAPDRKKPGLLDRIADHLRRYWQLWILSAPALFFVGLFSYVPMWGIQLAFREFDPTKGRPAANSSVSNTSWNSSTTRCLVRL